MAPTEGSPNQFSQLTRRRFSGPGHGARRELARQGYIRTNNLVPDNPVARVPITIRASQAAAGVVGRFTNLNHLQGTVGEYLVKRALRKRGYEILMTVKNNSDNGLDIIARNSRGKLRFIEVKAHRTPNLPSVRSALSIRQRRGAGWFADDILSNAANKTGRYQNISDAMSLHAQQLRRELGGEEAKGIVAQVHFSLGANGSKLSRLQNFGRVILTKWDDFQ